MVESIRESEPWSLDNFRKHLSVSWKIDGIDDSQQNTSTVIDVLMIFFNLWILTIQVNAKEELAVKI